MDANVTVDGSVISVVGEIDAHSVAEVDAALVEVDDAGATVLDLSGVTFVDSSGLRSIVAAHKRARDAGGSLTVRRPSPAVRRLLELTGLDGVLVID